jgi:hypothetical protein
LGHLSKSKHPALVNNRNNTTTTNSSSLEIEDISDSNREDNDRPENLSNPKELHEPETDMTTGSSQEEEEEFQCVDLEPVAKKQKRALFSQKPKQASILSVDPIRSLSGTPKKTNYSPSPAKAICLDTESQVGGDEMWTVRRLRRRTTGARNNKPDKKSNAAAKKTNIEEKETSEKEDRDMDEKDEDTSQTETNDKHVDNDEIRSNGSTDIVVVFTQCDLE